ncbi:MAG: 50S ribosomal protein L23 [FCB group bacterium]|nr:50S ribosomal protein L23 [FCB group bacterium]
MTANLKVLKRPLITEKISNQTDEFGKYAFEVDKRANKIEIKKAVESRFDVDVTNVRTMNVRGKMKRMGKFQGRQSSWKKAVITLKEGQAIDFFDNI